MASAFASFGTVRSCSASSASGTASSGLPSARRQSAITWLWSLRPEMRRYVFSSFSASFHRPAP